MYDELSESSVVRNGYPAAVYLAAHPRCRIPNDIILTVYIGPYGELDLPDPARYVHAYKFKGVFLLIILRYGKCSRRHIDLLLCGARKELTAGGVCDINVDIVGARGVMMVPDIHIYVIISAAALMGSVPYDVILAVRLAPHRNQYLPDPVRGSDTRHRSTENALTGIVSAYLHVISRCASGHGRCILCG